MSPEWIFTDWTTVTNAIVVTFLSYATVILYVRLTGLRSFSQMTATDFAMTIAVGSLLGSSVVRPSPSYLLTAVGLGCLFIAQWVIALVRSRQPASARLLDNTPALLMAHGEMLEDNMRRCRVSRADLNSKLRERGIARYEQVLAVVFETTGTVSVIAKSSERDTLDLPIFDNVDGSEVLHRARRESEYAVPPA
jgi:uncharacterized membrane protein YcaP (DUF421 family)